MEGVYQRDQNRRGQYYANLMFLEQLHARRDAVGDPEQAALFFVPVMVMQMAGNLWHPYEFLRKTVHHLQHAYPFWNRSAGTDHIFFLTTDRGGCWKPWALQHSLIISYLGFRASEGYFGFEERLMWPRQGPNNRNNAYSIKRGSEALDLDCYVPGKDVVVPVDANLGSAEEAKLPIHDVPFACKRGPQKVLTRTRTRTGDGAHDTLLTSRPFHSLIPLSLPGPFYLGPFFHLAPCSPHTLCTSHPFYLTPPSSLRTSLPPLARC